MPSSLWTNAGRISLALLLAIHRPELVSASVPLSLCASFNTADMGKNISIFQTNGLCKDFCTEDYAYAITQSQACWCSNYTPDKDVQVDTSDCNIPCPAWPDEKCGGKGLFGYVELGANLPSGTKGPDSSSKTSTANDSSKTDSDTTTNAPSPIQTVTTDTGGAVQTVTIFPTVTGNVEGGEDGSSSGSGGLGTGAIVGITIGVIAAVLGAAGIAFMLWRRRRQNQNNAAYQEDPSISARGSSSDRMNSIRPEMSAAAASPVTPSHNNSNRNSTLPIDPRMNPFNKGLYGNTGSQESINTLRDDHDYSRRIQQPVVLRATNPDPQGAD